MSLYFLDESHQRFVGYLNKFLKKILNSFISSRIAENLQI